MWFKGFFGRPFANLNIDPTTQMKPRENQIWSVALHQRSEVFYWLAGVAVEWHLSSERVPAPRQGEFIWFDTWCAAHIFTGAYVVEPRA